MYKEYDIEYLIGFEIDYDIFDKSKRFSITNDSVISEIKLSENYWVKLWKIDLIQSKFIIKSNYIVYSNRTMIIPYEFIEKLEVYYTYMKRKEMLKELGI